MTHHNITLHATTTGGNEFEVGPLPDPPPPEPPKPNPGCCPAIVNGPIWWEEKAHGHGHQPGWTGVANVSIPSRMYWLYNPTFCPLCGTKLPDGPPR